MTYLGFLILFLGVPILILATLALQHPIWRRAWIAMAALSLVALLYTTPWDNHLVAIGVWGYDPQRVLGITLGWVPLEEYLFFVLQPILVCLWAMAGGLPPPLSEAAAEGKGRWGPLIALAALEIGALGVWISGPRDGAYLSRILAWGVPPLALQVAVGGDRLWAARRAIARRWIVPTLWLWLADGIAIQAGIWFIRPEFTVGLEVAGLPLEEMVFFAMTNLLVANGWTLILDPVVERRICPAIRWAWLSLLRLRTSSDF
ncbi:MAG: lycopene cyclase domain-containing protein [Thermoflexus sp.]|nr:lycopene cyclase domain-containing protein [Thermoflexus sp.]